MMSDDTTEHHQPDQFMHRTFNWELVRGFGQSPMATVSIAIPFIGFAILYHAELDQYLGGLGGLLDMQLAKIDTPTDQNQPRNLTLISVYTRLNLIYVGSVLVGIATILYRLFAPKTVKEFSSISHFVDSELPRATARRLRTMFVTINSRRAPVAAGLLKVAPWLDRSHCTLKMAVGELVHLQDNQTPVDVLSSFYNVESRYSNRLAVYITVALYVVGFVAAAIPGLLFTFRVLGVILQSWF